MIYSTTDETYQQSTFSLDLNGYVEIAYIDLSPETNDSLTENYLDTIDLTATSSVTSSTVNTSLVNYHCDINFNISLDFQLPDYLKKPYPNLTLFKKANDFSLEIHKLNDTLIKIFQEMQCCGVSDEYNKTVVPVFRYLASSKDHTDCGDSPNLIGEDCGGKSNFMQEVLSVVKDITKFYTAIEPLFCLISPIPGNPWLPIDFNWMLPIKPYIQEFSQVFDKIMSGSLFDLVIDPIKNLNRALINCTSAETSRNIYLRNKNNIDELNSKVISLKEQIDEVSQAQSSALDPSNPIILNSEDTLAVQTQELNDEFNLLDAISNTVTNTVQILPENTSSQAYKLKELRNPGQGICRCILKTFDMEVRLPKFPKATIKVLPLDNGVDIYNINTNDLLKYNGEETYAITYGEVYNTFNDPTEPGNQNKIIFDQTLTTDSTFINNFARYMDNDSSIRSYYALTDIESSIGQIDPLQEIELSDFYTRLNENLPLAQFEYTDKSEYFKETISSYNTAMSSGVFGLSLTVNSTVGKPTEIIKNNMAIVKKIKAMSDTENKFIAKLEEFKELDYSNWEQAKIKSEEALKTLDLGNTGDFTFTTVTEFKQQNLHMDFFGSYYPIDLNYDFEDTRLINKLAYYGDIKDTEIYAITYEYVMARKNITYFGDSPQNIMDDIEAKFTAVADSLKNLKGQDDLSPFMSLDPENPIYNDPDNPVNLVIEVKILQEQLFTDATYGEGIVNILSSDAGKYFIDIMLTEAKNDRYPHIPVIANNNVYVFDDEYGKALIDNTLEIILNGYPVINITGQLYNFAYYFIKILQCEEYKLTLFTSLEENTAYSFYLTDYPSIDCNCDTIVCKLLQMVVNFLLYYINNFIGQIMEWLIEWLIPKWLSALIDIILYKLKCIMEIVYMEENLSLIDSVYESFLQSIKTRVDNYPYENCVDNTLQQAIDDLIAKNSDEINTDGTYTEDDALEELKNHNIDVIFVDLNDRKILSTTMSKFETIRIKVSYDIGATVESIILKDASVSSDASDVELISQESNIVEGQRIYVVDIPLDKIISGKLKVLVKSVKPTADVPVKFANDVLDILDFIDESELRLILSDFGTGANNIFLERNKETLLVQFNVLPLDSVGDATQNIFLLKNYIQNITLYDKAPTGEEPLPNKIFTGDTLSLENTAVYYDENLKLFSFIVDCRNFFPASRKIYGTIETKAIYEGISLKTNAEILCVPESTSVSESGIITDTDVNGNFDDVVIYSPSVDTIPSINQTEEDASKNNIEVRQNTPLIFDCSNSKYSGTNARIIELNAELRETWEILGLV